VEAAATKAGLTDGCAAADPIAQGIAEADQIRAMDHTRMFPLTPPARPRNRHR
jgi:hypothetical protein